MITFKDHLLQQNLQEYAELGYYDYLLDEGGYDLHEELNESAYDDKDLSPETVQRRNKFHTALDATYGKSTNDDKPLTDDEKIHHISKHLESHFSKSPKDQKDAVLQAKTRLGAALSKKPSAVAGSILSANSKVTRTGDDGKVQNHQGHDVTKNFASGGLAGQYIHKHGDKFTRVITCKHATKGCRDGENGGAPLCLAKTGAYGFSTVEHTLFTKSHITNDSRGLKSGNHNPALDHALIKYSTILDAAKKKAKMSPVQESTLDEGEAVSIRNQTTDEMGYADREILHRIKMGTIKTDPETHHAAKNHLESMDYTKDPNSNRKYHKPELGMSIRASDTGPAVKSHTNTKGETSAGVKNTGNLNRTVKQTLPALKAGIPTYTVIGGRLNHENAHHYGANPGDVVKRPKSNATNHIKDVHDKVLHSVGKVRRYDLHHTSHVEGEPEEYHNENGHGYTTITQDDTKKRIHYQEYHVPKSGHSHDGRYDKTENELGKTHDRHGKPMPQNNISTATSATSHEALQSSMTHDINNIKHGKPDEYGRTGTLHVDHPNELMSVKHNYTRKKIDIASK